VVSIIKKISLKLQEEGSNYLRVTDFVHLKPGAVSQPLSRLTKKGDLVRVSKGLYYRPHPTRFGPSRPSKADIQKTLIDNIKPDLHPAGITAANLLGFTSQNALAGEFATSSNSLPKGLLGSHAKVYTRRPTTWKNLSDIDAALLDFLRSRGKLSEILLVDNFLDKLIQL